MPNIKPVSDLRNYPEVLNEVRENQPVFLTKNGRGSHVILTIDDYNQFERMKAELWLLSSVKKAEAEAERDGWLSMDDVFGDPELNGN